MTHVLFGLISKVINKIMHSIDTAMVQPYQQNVTFLVSVHYSTRNRWVSCDAWCYEIMM